MKNKVEIRRQLELERTKLNEALAQGKSPEECLEQSELVDRLIEEYMDLD